MSSLKEKQHNTQSRLSELNQTLIEMKGKIPDNLGAKLNNVTKRTSKLEEDMNKLTTLTSSDALNRFNHILSSDVVSQHQYQDATEITTPQSQIHKSKYTEMLQRLILHNPKFTRVSTPRCYRDYCSTIPKSQE